MTVYLDNATTSWPKPLVVVEAMSKALNDFPGNAGRSAHSMSLHAARLLFETREYLAEMFHVPQSDNVIFTANATYAANFALYGMLKKGDHVITTSLEHNAVMRPLKDLESKRTIGLTVLPLSADKPLCLPLLKEAITPQTRMLCMTHGSNVNGTLLSLKEAGKLCHQNNILFFVDASQTAGIVPINMNDMHIDLMVFSGHKKMMGPSGIGVLCINGKHPLRPLIRGGTGSLSEHFAQPDFLPDALEAGTPNIPGIAGLYAAAKYIMQTGIKNIYAKTKQLADHLISQLQHMEELTIYEPLWAGSHLPIVAFNIKNMTCSYVAEQLDQNFGIMCRSGLHCAPQAHKALGSFPQGSVRCSPGMFNTFEDITYTINALKTIIHNENH